MPPPTGTVTFLFTDIEGSTGRWEAQTEEMRGALAAHDEVLRKAIEGHGGWLFKHTGDGVVAAFSSARSAVDAAVEAQRALELPVRMGLASGEAELRDGDYFGPTLNRASRMEAAGHGGQVLLAASTAGLVDGIDLLDLGEHRLRDLSAPQRVFQVRAPGLKESFPPLRTLTTIPGNLPAQLTSFVGRGEELVKLAEAVSKHRLVTLTGVGGVGKTRLALHAAAELAPDYRGGAWLVELAPVNDPTATAHAIAATLGITQQPERTIGESLVEALAFRELLLVLDNCEHLIEEVANLAGEIVGRCPGVRLLATSREALMIDGERTWPVPSLSFRDGAVSPAVTLFAERAEAIVPSFDLAADAEAVSEICRRLDGIPLAIELAAARVRSMSPAQVRDRLDERFRLLTGGSRRALERHQTLRHAVQWSYDLLSEEERALLCRASVFARGFSLEAAEGVCAGDAVDEFNVLDLLDSLVRKSLVSTERVGDEVRYGLLETIRQFGEEQLAVAGEVEARRRGHAAYFAAAAAANWETYCSPRQRLAIEWFERELANLRVAFRWSMEAGDIATAAGIAVKTVSIAYFQANTEPVGWATEAVAPTRLADLSILPDLLGAAAASIFTNQIEEGLRFAEEAIRLADSSTRRVHSTLPWFCLGMGLASSGRSDAALEPLRAGMNRQEDVPLLWCRSTLASFLSASGQHVKASAIIAEAVRIATETGVPSSLSYALMTEGAVRMYAGDVASAVNALERSAAVAREVGLDYQYVLSRRSLGEAFYFAGASERALPLLLEQMESGRASGDRLMTSGSLGLLAAVSADLGRPWIVATLSAEVAALGGFEWFRERTEEAIALARAALGDVEFERLAAEGAAMPFPELVRYAEEQIRLALAGLGDDDAAAASEARP